jgi:predicted dehydrogenase
MSDERSVSSSLSSRRDFLKTSAVAGAAVGLAGLANVHAADSATIKIGLVGCGGRGTGAADNSLSSTEGVKIVALADAFQDRLDGCRNHLTKAHANKVDLPKERCFVGLDAYKDLLKTDIDIVLLATPPGFRPTHIEAAVAAGKNIFCEKPVATDAPGIRRVLAAAAEAKKKGLASVAGTQRRHQTGYNEIIKRLHDGAIGNIVGGRCFWNQGALWSRKREDFKSDLEWQIRNWLYFTWLSGDFNVEQHIHSLDKMAWAMKDEYPIKAVGLGGRQVRTSEEFGHIFDHHSVVYEYKNGIKLFSNCRQQANCANDVSDHIFGTKGVCDVFRHSIKGEKPWKYVAPKDVREPSMYQVEHNELIASIRSGKPINNGDYMAKSTLMAIMGRMATYTGQSVTWEKALNSTEVLMPATVEFGSKPVPEVARPGITKLI